MNKIKLVVEKSTLTEKGNFANKLVHEELVSVETAFGTVEQNRKSTYYLFTKAANEVGKSAEIDLDLFDVVPTERALVDGVISAISEETKHEDIITLKYLYPKR